MIRKQDPDSSVDALLRGTLKRAAHLPTVSECPTPETIAAWADGGLPATEALTVEAHLSACARCQEIVAAFARTTPAHVPAQTSWQRWRLGWLVPVAAAGTAVAIWVSVPRNTPEEILQEKVAPAEGTVSAPQTSNENATIPPVESLKQAPRQDAAARSRAPQTSEQDAAKDEKETRQFADQSAAADQIAVARPAAPGQAAPAATAAEAAAPNGRQEIASLRQAAAEVIAVSPNGTNFWRVVRGGGIERSTDRGQTWQAAVVDDPGPLSPASSSPAETVCWFVGPGGRILLTTDAVRFRRVPFPENADLAFVSASSATSAIVSTDGARESDRRRFRTEDGGKTWQILTP